MMVEEKSRPVERYEIGCYFDGAFGSDHNMLRILDLAKQHDFNDWSSRLEQKAYSPNGLDDDDYDAWVSTIDGAIDFLNDNTNKPDGSYWAWEDGDFGLWMYDDEGELMDVVE